MRCKYCDVIRRYKFASGSKNLTNLRLHYEAHKRRMNKEKSSSEDETSLSEDENDSETDTERNSENNWMEALFIPIDFKHSGTIKTKIFLL